MATPRKPKYLNAVKWAAVAGLAVVAAAAVATIIVAATVAFVRAVL